MPLQPWRWYRMINQDGAWFCSTLGRSILSAEHQARRTTGQKLLAYFFELPGYRGGAPLPLSPSKRPAGWEARVARTPMRLDLFPEDGIES